jgi:IclR family acetate operon transcriptional repressor
MSGKVPSVERALGCLEVLATSHESLSLADIARVLSAPKSSVLMLLRTLVDLGYVERDDNERYAINPALMGYGSGWIGGKQGVIISAAWKTLKQLTDSVQETCFLAHITNEYALRFLAKVVSPREIRYDVSMRKLSVPHKTASGRAILAYWDDKRLQSYLSSWSGTKIPAIDRVDPQKLKEQLSVIRKTGIGLIVDEWVAGATGISATIFDFHKQPIAAITVGAVTARYLADREQIIDHVKKAAQQVSALLPQGLRAF